MPSSPGLHPDTFLHAILDSVGVALLVIDSEGRFVFTNQAALKMFGSAGSVNRLSLAEVMRNGVFRERERRPIPLEGAPIMRALAGEEFPPQDIDVTLPDGRRKWLQAAGHHFSVLGMTGVLVIFTDVTEQVELRLILERAQRAEALGLLAGGLVHDLNNMHSVISGNIAFALGRRGCSGECAPPLATNDGCSEERNGTGEETRLLWPRRRTTNSFSADQ